MSMVFISYSRSNEEAVKALVADLQDVGVDTWLDQKLYGGESWWDSILVKIRACDIFIFALSPQSWESEACKSELEYVSKLGKPILPILVSDGVNLSLLTDPLAKIQVTDYRLRDRRATLALVKAIHSTSAAPPLPDPLPTPPEVPKSYAVALQRRITSEQPLSHQEQNLLFIELEEAVEAGRPRAEIRDLLMGLKKRDDLLAKVGVKVDGLLKRLEQPNGGNGHPEAVPDVLGRCPRCAAAFGAGAIFCGSCGTKLAGGGQAGPGGPNFRENPSGSLRPGWKCCQYVCAADDVPRLIKDVVGWLNAQGFDSQELSADNHGLLLQITKRGEWRNLLGMATAVNVLFNQSGGTLTVEIGNGKWADKAAVGAIGIIATMGALALTAGYGAWEQAKMPEKIFQYVGTRLAFR